MNLKDFFNSELVSLPKGGFDDSKETFDQFLNALLERYLGQLQLVDDHEFPEFKARLPDVVTAAGSLATRW